MYVRGLIDSFNYHMYVRGLIDYIGLSHVCKWID